MARDGMLIGEVAKHSGASRKAVRLYEHAGILPPARRTDAGYRLYGADAVNLLAFVRQAQRLGFTLPEIKEIVSIRRRPSRSAERLALNGSRQRGRLPSHREDSFDEEGHSITKEEPRWRT